jgi:endoglucanase
MKKTSLLILLAVLMFAVSACGGKTEQTSVPTQVIDTPTISIEIFPVKAQLTPGENIQLNLSGANNITWSSSDPYVAKVDENGMVTAGHKGGTATISANVEGVVYQSIVTNTVTMRDINSNQLVSEMVIGSNFAGALDWIDWDQKMGYLGSDVTNGQEKMAYYFSHFETFIPTDQDVTDFKTAGYNAIRLPVSFTPFTDDKTNKIDPEFLDTVEKAVNQFLGQGMYVIIDPHYDYLGQSFVQGNWEELWMLDKYSSDVNIRYQTIWTQIADRFKDYDDNVLFEAFNEPSISYDAYTKYFNGDSGYNTLVLNRVNEMDQIFLKTVRLSGGNNATRKVLLATANYDSPEALSGLTIPDDQNVIATVHYYYHNQDGSDYSSWSSKNASDTKPVDKVFAFISKFKQTTGLPVIIGEWGNSMVIPTEDRIDQARYILNKAKDLGVPCFWWEFEHRYDSEPLSDHFSLYDHKSHTWLEPELLKNIMDIAYNR